MRVLTLLIFFLVTTCSLAQTRVWLSGSVLWGQAAGGVIYKKNNTENISLRQSGVFDYEDGFDYSETKLHYSKRFGLKRIFVGSRFIFLKYEDRSSWSKEIAPFIAMANYSEFGILNFYNSIEYRDRESKDYWRSEHSVTFNWPVSYTAYKIRPFATDALFLNVNDASYEKNRVYTGISLTPIPDVPVFMRIYYVHADGLKGREWDDRKSVGLALTYEF